MTNTIDLKDAYTDFVENPDESLSLEKRREKKQTIQNILSEDELEEFGKGELRELIRNLWAYHGWTNKEYILEQMLQDGLSNVVNSLQTALYEEQNPGSRFEELYDNINMMGPAASTEILTFVHPDTCAIYNQRAEESLARLGLSENLPTRIDDGKDYSAFLDVLDDLQEDIANLEVTADAEIRDHVDLDYFLYHITQIDIENGGGERPDEIEFDHEEIKNKIVAIGDKLGFDPDPEYDAGPRARIDVRWRTRVANLGMISYAFEVQHKGSPDSAILNLKKAEAADPSIQKSIIVSTPEQIETFKNEIEAMGGDFSENVSYLTGEQIHEAEETLSDLKQFLDDAGLTEGLSN